PTVNYKLMGGNLGEFLGKQVVRYGGKLNLTTNNIKPITGTWLFNYDKNGFQVITDGDRFEEVNKFFANCLGAPDIATENQPGSKFIGYHVLKAGVAIQYAIEPGPFREIPSRRLLHVVIQKPR